MNVLFLCTANIHRSKTAEILFQEKCSDHTFKSAGLSEKYCRQYGSQLCTTELLDWAEQVYVMEKMHVQRIAKYAGEHYLEKVKVLGIEDIYQYMQPELIEKLLVAQAMIATQSTLNITPSSAFKLGNNILEKWACTENQKHAILGISKKNYQHYLKELDSVHLTAEQLKRLSYIANIHEALRILFSNPDNVYGFMKMNNGSEFFQGRSPLSKIDSGDFQALSETCTYIQSLSV